MGKNKSLNNFESEEMSNSEEELKKLKMIDLCAGTGAFSYAFESTGLVDVVYANDLEPTSKMIYDKNFDHELTLGDLCNVKPKNIPSHNILTMGFSCQPFSIAGKQLGFDDPRTNIFWKLLEIIKYHQTDCVILENVKNLVSHDNGDTLKTIINCLKKEKYHIKYKVLNTSSITDIPQHRERIYIICVKNKKIFNKFDLDFSEVKKKKINSLILDDVDKKYSYCNKESKIHQMVINDVVKKNTIYQFRRVYVRENKSNECPTLTANMGTGGHNVPLILGKKYPRKLTPRECFNFQGFPDDYILPPKISDSKLYKLAGNAVSVPVVKLIADRLVPILFDLIF
jgi:DNA (cytosine-5)-methyltransferase 1